MPLCVLFAVVVVLLQSFIVANSAVEAVPKRSHTWKRLLNHVKNTDSNVAQRSTCTDLVNHGTHFTVEIEVGTPGQKFDVVADTGSDAIIVPSCTCVKAGYCNKDGRCFQGTNRSSTFHIKDGPDGPQSIRMMFGSGPVQAVVASDTVRVGSLKTQMRDGILLMTDQLLNIKGPFEGILGLGLPTTDAKKGLYKEADKNEPSSKQMHPDSAENSDESRSADQDDGEVYASSDTETPLQVEEPSPDSYTGVNIFPFPAGIAGPSTSESNSLGLFPSADFQEFQATTNVVPASNAAVVHLDRQQKPSASHEKEEANATGIVMKGFMEEIGIERFTMCFNDGAPGVLRLGTPKPAHPHGSVGKVHWGLDFRGISVGNASVPAKFCDTRSMKKGQKSPCGAIPDSGTTALMAPKEHLISLYGSLCDNWTRCSDNYTAMEKAADDASKAASDAYGFDPFNIRVPSKAEVFQQLVLDCRYWLTKQDGLDELPSIHLHIGGAGGSSQTLDLDGWSYIIETNEKEYDYVYKQVPGWGRIPYGKKYTGNTVKVCSPAFSPMEYKTEQNGPVWILGTPIFYGYQVGYDLKTEPPSMSFTQAPCGSCSGKASLVSEEVSTHRSRRAREPRKVLGPLRVPDMDVSKPL